MLKLVLSFFLICFVSFGQEAQIHQQLLPDDRYKADLLLVVAHPDDETAIGSQLAKLILDDGMRVAIVYCTRGTGGGNSNGGEQSTAMGLMRETEVRKACANFGIFNVWFIDGIDTPGQDVLQSLARWGHGKVLEQLVRIVRLTRPDVIITWLPHFVAGENHGDHQASGVIATEAFDVAGDPTMFPYQVMQPRESYDINQLYEGLHPWQPKKLYFFSDASHEIDAPGPAFDLRSISPSKGIPYYQLALGFDTLHLTQGGSRAREFARSGNLEEFAKSRENFKLIFGKAVAKTSPSAGIFEDVTTEAILFQAARGYRAPLMKKDVSIELGGPWVYYRNFWPAHDLDRIGPLVGPELETSAGSYTFIPLIINNGTPDTVTVILTPETPMGWKLSSGGGVCRVAPQSSFPAQTFFFAPGEVSTNFQNIVWKAEVNGKPAGMVSVQVKVSEWTLPW